MNSRTRQLPNFHQLSFLKFDANVRESSCKIFTAHYACRNADLNLIQVMGTTNRFIFQIINSLIESWGVCLTCFDCKVYGFHPADMS